MSLSLSVLVCSPDGMATCPFFVLLASTCLSGVSVLDVATSLMLNSLLMLAWLISCDGGNLPVNGLNWNVLPW